MASLNGRLPTVDLRQLSTSRKGEKLTPTASRLFDALNELYKEQHGSYIYVTDSYRSYSRQVALKQQKGAFAATPGTSIHGWGRALDLGSGVNIWGHKTRAWMEKFGPKFGWRSPAWAQRGQRTPEPWHWEFAISTRRARIIRDSNMRVTPNGKIRKVSPKGTAVAIVRGSEIKKGGHTWLLTTHGNWIASTQFKYI